MRNYKKKKKNLNNKWNNKFKIKLIHMLKVIKKI